MALPTAPIVAAGLVGGYASARHAGRDDLATAVFTGAAAWCVRAWRRRRGARVSHGLLGCYLLAFWASHPLARRLGAWPSVLATTALAASTTYAVADHPRRRADADQAAVGGG